MSFEMSRSDGSVQEAFHQSDEAILVCADESKDYPQLSIIWRDFYKSIRIYPGIAAVIAKELRLLCAEPELDRLASRCAELAVFFDEASESDEVIYCDGD